VARADRLQSAKRKILTRQKEGAQDDNLKWVVRMRLTHRCNEVVSAVWLNGNERRQEEMQSWRRRGATAVSGKTTTSQISP